MHAPIPICPTLPSRGAGRAGEWNQSFRRRPLACLACLACLPIPRQVFVQWLDLRSGICPSPSPRRPGKLNQAAARQAEKEKENPRAALEQREPVATVTRSLLTGIANLASAACDGFVLGMDDNLQGQRASAGQVDCHQFAFRFWLDLPAASQPPLVPRQQGSKAEMFNLETT